MELMERSVVLLLASKRLADNADLCVGQISDNPALFQPLEESDIMLANSGEIINNRVWGEQVRILFSEEPVHCKTTA
jgi:hypothetical protein